MSGNERDDGLGKTAILASSSTREKSVAGFRLDVVEGPSSGKHWESKNDRCTIGHNPSCDVVLEDPTVSRFHCEVAISDQGTQVRDLGSSNGTLIDGVRVLHAFLKRGSLLRLGRSALRFQYMDKRNRISLSERTQFGILTGQSVVMRAMFAILDRAAATDITILLQGETGTGKSAAARSIHSEGSRKSGPFVMLDCGAIPANLLESEIFGHERGAFTGADAARIGAFEEASSGTIFLDEIGEMPIELQSKLLSALENREIRRLGSNKQIAVDVRVIAATNRDLRAEVNAGRFREDLYYRLAVVNINIPPLRQRLEDLPQLVETLLERLGTPQERIESLMTPDLMRSLRASAWPGNLRELRNHLEQYLVFEDIMPSNLAVEDPEANDSFPVDVSLPLSEARQQAMAEFERRYLTELLETQGGKVSRAAAHAGVDRTYLYRLLRRHKLKG